MPDNSMGDAHVTPPAKHHIITIITIFFLLTLYGCADSQIMVMAPSLLSSDPQYSVISFIKKGKKEPDSALWEGEHFIGILTPETIIQRKLPGGKHSFMAITEERCTPLRADIAPEKNYAVMMSRIPDLGEHFLPMAGKMTPKVEQWLSLYPAMVPLEQERLAIEQRDIEKVRSCYRQYENTRKGPVDILSSELYLLAHESESGKHDNTVK